MAEIGKTSAKAKRGRRGAATKMGKTKRKRKVKGNGSDSIANGVGALPGREQ